jgi:hypothetical protein
MKNKKQAWKHLKSYPSHRQYPIGYHRTVEDLRNEIHCDRKNLLINELDKLTDTMGTLWLLDNGFDVVEFERQCKLVDTLLVENDEFRARSSVHHWINPDREDEPNDCSEMVIEE